MGSTRGNAETGFISSVAEAVDHFYFVVVAGLERLPARRPSSPGAGGEGAGQA